MLQTKFFLFFGHDNYTIQLSNYHQLVVSDNYVKQSGSQKKLVHCIKHFKIGYKFFLHTDLLFLCVLRSLKTDL